MTSNREKTLGGWRGLFPPVDEMVIAIGIGLIVFLRPWFDGITYPEYNVPFTWACGAIAAFWAVMVLAGRMQPRFMLPVSLFSLFLLVAVVTSPFTVQYDATYRSLINWSGYLLLFSVAANALRSRTSIAIVAGFFAVTSIAESVYAVLHVTYIMPRTRMALLRDPGLLQTYFNTDTMSPELSARMESNRAYGSLLFANALACWLLTGIPIAIASANGFYARLRAAIAQWRETGGETRHGAGESARVLIATTAVGAAAFIGITLYYMVYFIFVYGEQADMRAHLVRWTIYCVALPSTLTIGAWLFASRYGAGAMLTGASLLVSALFGITGVYGLGATYSRGGMLAATVALIALAALMHQRRGAGPGAAPRAAVTLLLTAASLQLAQLALAQEAVPTLPEQATPREKLALEGVNPSMQAMLDPNTALLRFGYWISGIHMFADHPLTGVGLGNFATAYPRYQIIGAGDVKPAHNDYLQAACETGVFGLIAFLGFWAYFVVATARSVLGETDRSTRWFRAGLFAGVLGFLVHSFVDFNFFNASLATLVFALAGVSFAFMPVRGAPTPLLARVLAIAVLALVAWTVYAGNRVTTADELCGRDTTRRVRLAILDKLYQWAAGPPAAAQNANVPFMAVESTVAALIENSAVRDSMGEILVPTGPTSYRHLQKGEVPPPTARRFMQPEARPVVRKAVLDAISTWIARCEEADAAYPHDPAISAHIVQWYDKLREYSADRAAKVRAADAEIKWCKVSIARSPLQTAYYDALAKALWDRGELETTAKQLEYYDRAIENWKRRTEIYPVKPVIWREYAENCIAYGKKRVEAGDARGGQKLIDEGNRAEQHARDLEKQIQDAALGNG